MLYYEYMITILENYLVLLIVWTYLGIVSILRKILHWCRVRDLHKIKMDLAAQGIFQRDMHDAISQVYRTRLIIVSVTLVSLGAFFTVLSVYAAWVWLIIIPVLIIVLAAVGKPAKPEPEIVETPHAFPRMQQPVAMSRPGRFDSIDSAAIALHQKERV